MGFVDQTAGSLCSAAHDLFRDSALGPSLFSLCRVTGVRLSAGFICVEKCHLAQAARALTEREKKGGRRPQERNNNHVWMQHLSDDLRELDMSLRIKFQNDFEQSVMLCPVVHKVKAGSEQPVICHVSIFVVYFLIQQT